MFSERPIMAGTAQIRNAPPFGYTDVINKHTITVFID